MTGLQYLGYGANKVKEKAIEHDVAGKTKAALLEAKKQSDERGFTEFAKQNGGILATNLKGAAIVGAGHAK